VSLLNASYFFIYVVLSLALSCGHVPTSTTDPRSCVIVTRK